VYIRSEIMKFQTAFLLISVVSSSYVNRYHTIANTRIANDFVVNRTTVDKICEYKFG